MKFDIKNVPSQDELKTLLDYDSESGIFRWKEDRKNSVKAGDMAGTLNGHTKRLLIMINKTSCKADKLAWLYTYGVYPKQEVYHINRVRFMNNISNLELETS